MFARIVLQTAVGSHGVTVLQHFQRAILFNMAWDISTMSAYCPTQDRDPFLVILPTYLPSLQVWSTSGVEGVQRFLARAWRFKALQEKISMRTLNIILLRCEAPTAWSAFTASWRAPHCKTLHEHT